MSPCLRLGCMRAVLVDLHALQNSQFGSFWEVREGIVLFILVRIESLLLSLLEFEVVILVCGFSFDPFCSSSLCSGRVFFAYGRPTLVLDTV